MGDLSILPKEDIGMEESGAPDGVEGKARGDQDSLASHGISVTIYLLSQTL